MSTPPRYRMPAEWEPHGATWIAWPHNQEHWPGNFEPIPKVFASFVALLARSEQVFICVNDEGMEASARLALSQAGVNEAELSRIRFFQIPTNASWSRDHGPIFVFDESGQLVVTDWVFNCWGEKYPPWDLDNQVPQKIAGQFQLPLLQPNMVLEGGSIDVNGRGSLLTTRQCLLNSNRNPKLSQREIEARLSEYLGAISILWLEEGIVGDDTDGHIDDIARFVNETTIACALESDEGDENYALLRKNFSDLQQMKDQDGKPFHLVPLPMPEPVVQAGQRLPASYLNFFIANTMVIVPTFRCQRDQEALLILQNLFPDRKVVGIDAVDWVWGLGTCHCSTQQMPALV
ncbi:MAG: agmatine deiminase family protein [bacterium]|nr:agmatine deiminase family protein [bacterium]